MIIGRAEEVARTVYTIDRGANIRSFLAKVYATNKRDLNNRLSTRPDNRSTRDTRNPRSKALNA